MESGQSGQNVRTPPPLEGQETASAAAQEESQKRIQELEAQLKEKENKYIYLYAEFENFKKRAAKERMESMRFGWESAARELLQVVDNLERAVAHMPPQTDKTLGQGIQMVLNQFKTVLQSQGVQSIQSLEQAFDPNLHEAVSQEDSDRPSGIILKEHTAGYTLHGRLLRPSRVTVSSGNQGSAQGNSNGTQSAS